MSDRFRGRAAVALLALGLSSALAAAEQPLRLTGPQTGEPVLLARDFHVRHAATLGLEAGDLEHRVSDVVPTRHNGLTHVYLQQTIDGIPVDGAVTTINVMADGSILNIADTFVAGANARTNAGAPAISPQVAMSLAAGYLNVRLSRPPMPLGGDGGPQRHAVFDAGALSSAPVPASLLYVRVGEELRLAWNLIVDRFDGESFHAEMRIDAVNGDLLDIASYVAHVAGDAHAARSKGAAPTDYSATYRVVPMPFESPAHPGAAFADVVNPHDIEASPRGWHDTRALGSTGFEFAETRGNNVTARADLIANNSAGNYRAPATVVGGNLVFAQQFDPDAQPTNGANQPDQGNVPAAVVNLFYWNNILHDVLWRYGFDEASGNFQTNNFGRGGSGADAVNADALDGSDLATPNTNNANFSTPADGGAPRMQMFRWLGPMGVGITAPYTATYAAFRAGFGAAVNAAFPGDLVLVDAGGATGIEGCTALVNAAQVSGKIAVVRRGTCEFGTKALIAQQAGAIGVIIFNNQGGDTLLSPGPGAQGGQVTIRVAFIGENDGNVLRAALEQGPGAGALLPPADVGPDRDSDFDAGIIGHEYAHGLSNRLTGGRTQATCLNNEEQAGEGWSDYVGLMLTMNGNDCAAPRGVGTYASFQSPSGPGIRRFPYSTNRAVNPFTFKDVADPLQSVPHGVGSVWATMLWEMTCALIDEHGFDGNLVTGSGGNNIAMQLVVDGMKLQPCRPSFVQARDAILAADVANNAGENRCLIWREFASRGLGLTASSGSNTSRSDQVEAFTMPLDCADHLVGVSVTGSGSVTPATQQGVVGGGTLAFQVQPQPPATLLSISGCGGVLNGSTYTTAPISADCTVTAEFGARPPEVFANGFETGN